MTESPIEKVMRRLGIDLADLQESPDQKRLQISADLIRAKLQDALRQALTIIPIDEERELPPVVGGGIGLFLRTVLCHSDFNLNERKTMAVGIVISVMAITEELDREITAAK